MVDFCITFGRGRRQGSGSPGSENLQILELIQSRPAPLRGGGEYVTASPLPPAPFLEIARLEACKIGCWIEVTLGAQSSLWVPNPVIWEVWRLHFGTLGDHLGDPGVPGDTPQGTLGSGPDLDFYRFWMDFGTLLGPTLGAF